MQMTAAQTCGKWIAVVLGSFLCAGMVLAQPNVEIEARPAIQAPLADQSLLLDVIRYNGSYITVGERGHVLRSDDGQTWTQAEKVPVNSTLTRATSADRRLWAVGHDSAIISSMDGGNTWFIQHYDPSAEEPLLDVLFLDANTGFAVGAYGRLMSTTDGGQNWTTDYIGDLLEAENIDWQAIAEAEGYESIDLLDRGCYESIECHLNEILQIDEERLMIAAERGYGYRSFDAGQSWESFRFPYPGSMFGLLPKSGCIVAFGLRGHIQRSCDFGDSWDVLVTDGDQTLMGGTVGRNDEIILVGSGATRIAIDQNLNINTTFDRLGSDYAAVLESESGNLILVGEDGVRYE